MVGPPPFLIKVFHIFLIGIFFISMFFAYQNHNRFINRSFYYGFIYS